MLLLCATPIGNLSDLTPRVREAFVSCDAVYCEDTRRTLALLNHIGIRVTTILTDDSGYLIFAEEG